MPALDWSHFPWEQPADWKIDHQVYSQYIDSNYPQLIQLFALEDPYVDFGKDKDILNKIDVSGLLQDVWDCEKVWKALTVAVVKMGYFGIYSRMAMKVEESFNHEDNIGFLFTFNQFMHVYPFLKELTPSVSFSFNDDSQFQKYFYAKFNFNGLKQFQSFNDEYKSNKWLLIDKTPLFNRYFKCSINHCPGLFCVTMDPIHELIFIKCISEHFNCYDLHKRKMYDIVKKSFVRFGGDLDYINTIYHDMPRRYGLGFVESSISHTHDPNQLNNPTWASTLKRRTMYSNIKDPAVITATPTGKGKLQLMLDTNLIDFDNTPNWMYYISTKIQNDKDLIQIYASLRKEYFGHEDDAVDSIQGVDWVKKYDTIRAYYLLKEQDEGLDFALENKSIIISKEIPQIPVKNILIIDDQSICTFKPVPPSQEDHQHTMEYHSQIEDGIEEATGVKKVLVNLFLKYSIKIKLFRLVNGVNGRIIGYLISEPVNIWSNVNKLLPNQGINHLNVLTNIDLNFSSNDSTQNEVGKPKNYHIFNLNFIDDYYLKSRLPPSIVNEINFSLLMNDLKFSSVNKLIKFKMPRQRAKDIDKLPHSVMITSPLPSQQHNNNLTYATFVEMTGTLRMSLKKMYSVIEELDSWISNEFTNPGDKLDEGSDDNEKFVDKMKYESNLAIFQALTKAKKLKVYIDQGLITEDLLKLMWLNITNFGYPNPQAEGNRVIANYGYGMDYPSDEAELNKIICKGKGIIGLINGLQNL